MSERTVEEIRLRHNDFTARYSPGPDWEPFNQTHQDRGFLLERIATLERDLSAYSAENQMLKEKAEDDGVAIDKYITVIQRWKQDRDADRAKIEELKSDLDSQQRAHWLHLERLTAERDADREAIRALWGMVRWAGVVVYGSRSLDECERIHAPAIARATQEPKP